ncbi:MAG: D-(-)-3-hydroxybutyrate oligomer hydrolase [Steroidobacteraceae bacterium]|jgi:hydroxybutyrate-dimer hydrolase|nr:D-(-)-3-hydroxybutyrate oligomer hydrolase [Steroidobacteraceae bacterium]
MAAELGMMVAAAVASAGLGGAAPALPAEIVGTPTRREFDGRSDDLLTAGLGLVGLRGGPPVIADPLRPTALELRRLAVYNAYRGLVDVTDAGGYGRLFGPAEGQMIAGVEILAAVRTPDGSGTTTVMLQVPSGFDAKQPCLVVASSSGSRGIYGALPTAAEWGLRNGCAVAHTDKGTGVGFFDLDTGTGYRIDLVSTRNLDDPLLTFRPADTPALADFRARHPHRVAVKHAHGGGNPEKDWGLYVLQAAQVGLELLNREFPGADGEARFTRANTRVIGAGVSNGGGAVLRAVEQDAWGLLDGAVVSEPNAQPLPLEGLAIRAGGSTPFAAIGRPLYDYATEHYLLQPAAVLAPRDPASPLAALNPAQRPPWEQWTQGLARLGLVNGETPEERSRDARRRLEAAGMLPEALEGAALNVQFGLWPAIAVAYASAHGRLPVEEPPCGVGYAATDPAFKARALAPAELARLAADGSGVPPTGGVQLVAELPGAGAMFSSFGSVELARCFRALATGEWPGGGALPEPLAALSQRVRAGMEEVRMSAALRGRPVIILHGRRDGLIPVNHTSRAYVARHLALGESSARYYEVEHGQHFDAFIPLLPGFSTAFVPLQPHVLAAMDLMNRHLRDGAPLPPSQVVRSTPRKVSGSEVERLEARHLGGWSGSPGANAIGFEGKTLAVPD